MQAVPLSPMKVLRLERKIDRLVVADAIGVSSKTLGRWEEGETYPTIPDAIKLAKFYGASLNQIAGIEPLGGAA